MTTVRQHLQIDLRRLPWASRFACDYVHDFDALADFFAGHPASPDAWRQAIARRRSQPDRCAAIARVVGDQLRRRGAPPAARSAAARLEDPAAVAVVTGQQAGLFGGPLFTFLKAVTTIQLSARVAADHGLTAVPVFWIDAEDHDFDEVRSSTILDAELRPRRIDLAITARPGTPCASVRLDDSIAGTIDELAAALQPTEFTGALVEQLRSQYAPGTGLADAFGTWLDSVLGPHGLVVFDGSDPAAKPCACAIFERELKLRGESARLAAQAGAQLAGRGYHAQVTPQPDTVALFRLDGTRTPIRIQGDELLVGDVRDRLDRLIAELSRSPASFSPNVLLRPVVQDTLFPTIAYVAGPNELAYLAQLRAVYQQFDVPMPLFVPRSTATVVDAATLKFLDRYAVPFETLQPQDEAALNRLLAAELPQEVERAFDDAQRAVRARMEALATAVPAVDPTLAGTVDATLGRMEHDLKTLHSKIIHAVKRRDETLRRQFHRAQAQAFPSGHPQERAIGSIYFLNRYGPAFAERLLSDLDPDVRAHWVLTV